MADSPIRPVIVTHEASETELVQSLERIRSPEHWVELFSTAFAAGSYAAVARLAQLTHPSYRGVQPQLPDAVGPAGFLELFSRLYALIPDLKGSVLRSSVIEDGVYIEVQLTGTLAGQPVTWNACDRFAFRDGLVSSRVTYLDPLPLFQSIARRPAVWGRWWRSGLGWPKRGRARALRPC